MANFNNVVPTQGLVSSQQFNKPQTAGTTTPGTYNPVIPGLWSGHALGGITKTQNSPTQFSLSTFPPNPNAQATNPQGSPPQATPDYSNYASYMKSQGFPDNTNSQYNPTPEAKTTNTYSGGTNGYGGVFPGLISTVSNMANVPDRGFTQAQNTSQQASQNLLNSTPQQNQAVLDQKQQIQNLQTDYANQTANIGGSRTNLSESGGEQGLLNNLYSGRLGALETGLQNVLQGNAQQQTAYNSAGQLANTAAGQATGQQGVQQSGLLGAAGLTYPQQVGPTNVPYNPAEGTYGQPANQAYGAGGLANVGILNSQVAAGQTYGQNSAILGKVQSQLPGLQQAIQDSNFNPSDATGINQIVQWGKGALSDSSIPKIQGSLNDIVGGLSQVLGVPSSGGSDFRLQFAGSIVNALQSGSSINDAISFAVQQAELGNRGYLKGANNALTNQNNAPEQQQGNGTTFGKFF